MYNWELKASSIWNKNSHISGLWPVVPQHVRHSKSSPIQGYLKLIEWVPFLDLSNTHQRIPYVPKLIPLAPPLCSKISATILALTGLTVQASSPVSWSSSAEVKGQRLQYGRWGWKVKIEGYRLHPWLKSDGWRLVDDHTWKVEGCEQKGEK